MRKEKIAFRQLLLPILLCSYLIGSCALTRAVAEQAGAPAMTSISNEFIQIRVNPGPNEAGRFAIDTTGGDPSRAADDKQVLIYGSRDPWTSYTTALIDGQPVVFGGPTARRAGKMAQTSGIKQPVQVSDNAVICWARVGDIEIEQALGFARNPTTRVKDAARILYKITNWGDTPHTVGLRIVLDTMLGQNDGAPLRVGARAIASATRIAEKDLPDYWQAFDSLSQPAVIAQGTLRGLGLTPPDRLEMVDWGTLADAPWDFPFPAGADFTRQGEQEQDTAVALYWEAAALKPGEARTYATLYGIGGVTLSPAQLSLGLSAPAEIDFQYGDTRAFTAIAYLENSGGFESRQTACQIELPKGLKLEEGQSKIDLGALKSGETKQLIWKVLPTGEATGAVKLAVLATSENLESNRVEREIAINSPPQLSLEIGAPDKLAVTKDNRYSPNPFKVSAKVTNLGAQAGRNLVVTLALPEGLRMADESSATQVSERIEPGASKTFGWAVRALGLPSGNLKLIVKATAAGAKAIETIHSLVVPELVPEMRVYPENQTVSAMTDGKPSLLPIAVKLAPAREFLGCRLTLTYDPNLLELLYISRGEAFVEAGSLLSPWSTGKSSEGRIENIGGERGGAPLLNVPECNLFTIVFVAKAPGETKVALEQSQLLGAGRKVLAHRLVAGNIKIMDMEENK
jgi:hypothetical protein